jgi:hypothetical protein
MIRSRNRSLSRLVAAATALLFLGTLVAEAEAQRRKKKAPARQQAKVNTRAIGELMGDFKFGMTRQQIVRQLGTQINRRYQELIKETTDVYEQDKLRRQRDTEIKRIRASYISFEGKRTGWDVSIIDDQFGHNTGESMMVYWENVDGKDQRRFFFFHEGRLYKMFIALNLGEIRGEQRQFSYFRNLMERRYGGGTVEMRADHEGVEKPYGILWRTPNFLVRALDKLEFYGSFCLIIADPKTEQTLVARRDETREKAPRARVIDAVIKSDDGDDTPGIDENVHAVDGILGR